jgi:hypothetical protein
MMTISADQQSETKSACQSGLNPILHKSEKEKTDTEMKGSDVIVPRGPQCREFF